LRLLQEKEGLEKTNFQFEFFLIFNQVGHKFAMAHRTEYPRLYHCTGNFVLSTVP